MLRNPEPFEAKLLAMLRQFNGFGDRLRLRAASDGDGLVQYRIFNHTRWLNPCGVTETEGVPVADKMAERWTREMHGRN